MPRSWSSSTSSKSCSSKTTSFLSKRPCCSTALFAKVARSGYSRVASQYDRRIELVAANDVGQMAVRIALQCDGADAMMILSEDNMAATRLRHSGQAVTTTRAVASIQQPFQVSYIRSAQHRAELSIEFRIRVSRRSIRATCWGVASCLKVTNRPCGTRKSTGAGWRCNPRRPRRLAAGPGESLSIERRSIVAWLVKPAATSSSSVNDQEPAAISGFRRARMDPRRGDVPPRPFFSTAVVRTTSKSSLENVS